MVYILRGFDFPERRRDPPQSRAFTPLQGSSENVSLVKRRLCFGRTHRRHTKSEIARVGADGSLLERPVDLRWTPTRPNKKPPEGGSLYLSEKQREIGAGEGIRTLDPNLGKVVLYP